MEFSTGLVFRCESLPLLWVGVEICEDLWVADTPSTRLCAGGATLILNPSASDEIVSKADWRRLLLRSTSGRLECGLRLRRRGPGGELHRPGLRRPLPGGGGGLHPGRAPV